VAVNQVTFVLPGLNRLGGAEREAILLAKGLARRGWRVSMVALSGDGGEAAQDLTAAGVTFLTLRMRKGVADPRGWIRFHRWLREQAPEVLHAHLPHATWIVRGSRLAAPVRVVVDTLHTSFAGPATRRLGYRMTGWLPDRVTAVSRGVAEAYVAAGLVRPERVTILPNGIDVDAWAPDAAERARLRAELGLTNEFLWCAAGRLEPVKDYPSLLRAFAGLPSPSQLVIAGSGTQEAELRTLAAEMALGDRVRFLGFQADVRHWMRAADGFVLSSLWEGLPMSLLEASACGLSSVATSVSGTREVLVEAETGFLAEPGSAESLRRAMNRLMQMRPENRESMGMNARQRIVEQFGLDAVLDRLEDLYRDLLEKNPHPRRYPARAQSSALSGAPATAGPTVRN